MSLRECLDQVYWGRKTILRGSLTSPSTANMVLADFALFSSFSLAKPLDYLPKASPQSLSPRLSTDSFLRQNTKVQGSKSIIWLYPLTGPIRTYQLSYHRLSLFFSLKTHSCKNTCRLSLSSPEAAPPPSEHQGRVMKLRKWAEHWCSSLLLTVDTMWQLDASCSCCHSTPIMRNWTPKL